MNALQSFTFDGITLRVFGDTINPVFIAADICKAIGIQNPSDAIKSLAPFERSKVVVDGHELNAVNESGLYTLILRSREAVKEGTPAYRFRLKVTAEILPAIRKQGRYECPAQAQLPAPTLTDQQAHSIMSRVAMRAKRDGLKYQTIYRALKERYQVTKYTHIPRDKFKDALEFIRTVDLRTPVVPGHQPAEPPVQNRNITASPEFCETLRRFVWYQRYVYAECHHKFHKYLQLVDSPLAGRYYDMYTSINLANLERQLAKIGFPVSDLECYKRTHGLDDIVAR